MPAVRFAAALVAVALLIGAAGGWLDRGLNDALRPLSPEETRAALHRVQVRAGAAYLAARGLGRVVAVASSATVNAGVGVGGSLDIGRVLDPIDKLLETFADVMMISVICVTAQIVLVDMLDAYALTLVLPVGLAVLAVAALLGAAPLSRLRRFGTALVVGALLAKLALPISVVTTEALSERFLQHRADQSAQVVQATQADVETARSWYDPRRLSDQIGATSPSDFVQRIDTAVDAILTWMTVFILETMLMPVAIALGVVFLVRAAVRRVAPI
jgi:hypothetical protein